jgi:hypothetical protein
MPRLRSNAGYDDWIVYVALLPALLILVGLGVTAILAWHNPVLRNAASPSASPIAGDEDYVQGLAKRVTVKRAAPEPPPALDDLLSGP